MGTASILNGRFGKIDQLGIDDLGIDSLGIDSLGIDSLGIDSLGIDSLGRARLQPCHKVSKDWGFSPCGLGSNMQPCVGTNGRIRFPLYVVAAFGAFIPNSFITICKSFQASPFCRGSRNRNAG
jgi:hypothetical protein